MLLLDDRTLLRESVASHLLLLGRFDSVLEVADVDAAVRVFEEHRPEVVLLSVDLLAGNGFAAARQIRRIDREARLICLAGRACDTDIEQALELPVQGFLLRQEPMSCLVDAIECVCRGETYFSEKIRQRLVVEDGHTRLSGSCSPAIAGLTPRECQLLVHISRGASLKEAATAMAISYKTADNQKASLMQKLDIHDRVELARFAIQEGLVSL
jgi:DNA-binding NarL/FixJ family response regulator